MNHFELFSHEFFCRKEGRKTKQYFEYSDNPYYNITRYIRTREGKSKFVREEVAVNAPGGIFNLEFNSDGKILAAACEKKNILIFDPLRREVVHSINDAHTDCVNCIRYSIIDLSTVSFIVVLVFKVS